MTSHHLGMVDRAEDICRDAALLDEIGILVERGEGEDRAGLATRGGTVGTGVRHHGGGRRRPAP